MRCLRLKIKWFLLAFLLVIPSVCAYLDPGTGAMLLQAIVGGVAVALFSIKMNWKKIKCRLTKQKDVSLPLEEKIQGVNKL